MLRTYISKIYVFEFIILSSSLPSEWPFSKWLNMFMLLHFTCKKPINLLNAELNPIRHLLALVEVRHIVHVSRIRVKLPLFNYHESTDFGKCTLIKVSATVTVGVANENKVTAGRVDYYAYYHIPNLRIQFVQNAPDDGPMRSETCRANISAE